MSKFNVTVRRRNRPPDLEPGLRAILKLLRRMPLGGWVILALIGAGMVWGTPHVLVTYHCYGTSCRHYADAYACDYLGVRGWRSGVLASPDGCKLMRLL